MRRAVRAVGRLSLAERHPSAFHLLLADPRLGGAAARARGMPQKLRLELLCRRGDPRAPSLRGQGSGAAFLLSRLLSPAQAENRRNFLQSAASAAEGRPLQPALM